MSGSSVRGLWPGCASWSLPASWPGPWAGQILADLGADVIKVERKGAGDDTRAWGPPFVPAADGGHLSAAYFHSTNRGKRSIEADFTEPEGQRIVKKLAARSDVLIENFKVGGLAKFGLDYASLAPDNPRLIYCSVTGFGQTGPYGGARRLRPDGAGHRRHDGPDRHAGRRADARRRRRSPIFSPASMPWSASSPRWRGGKNRQGRLRRCGAGRFHRRRAVVSGAQLSRLRRSAQTHRQCPSQSRSLSGVSGRRRPHHHRHRQRRAIRQIVRHARRAAARRRARIQ